ncbi:hypothetical protein [Streptomyces rishiriensis]|uniref:Integral membrane protein n=1 Tax=Streptomyces rishiriensis TaxID=68264 RepID=A0ABU0NN56_STRRH|nr:hypothetical protein [Streptomyces rishiriensis]MDQ0580548.1 hypothetical protein [Streptomyces rishiriensis]
MNAVARRARPEWGPLYEAVRVPWVRRRWRALPMTLGAVCLTSVTQVVQNRSWGYGPVQALGAVRAEDPLGLALLRTPLSLFVPALDLPVWGALAQILLVFGIAELCLGWWRTLVIAYAATLAGTLYARVGIALGPGGPLGLPAADARIVDTGPSAAVVGLAVFLGWRYRAYATAGAVIVSMVVEVLLKDNLAGKEHLAAIAAVLVLCAVAETRGRRGPGRSARGLRGGTGARSRRGTRGVAGPRPRHGARPATKPRSRRTAHAPGQDRVSRLRSSD